MNVFIETLKNSDTRARYHESTFQRKESFKINSQYPYDYGFIPNTLADDGDPLDGMVIMDQPTFPGCVIAARPLGMLEMIDGGDRDEKLLCVPAKDPRYTDITSLDQISPHRLEEIAEFFRTYKNLEKKVTEIQGWKGVDRVMPLLAECIEAAKKG